MLGKVLGESWRIYRQRFGIMLFFSFIFYGLGYTLYYAGILAINRTMSGVSMDIVNLAVRLVQGMRFEDLFYANPYMAPSGLELAALPLLMILLLGAAGLVLAYGILAVPMGMGGLTVLSSGAPGPLTCRSVFNGVKQRYGKLLSTYLCMMVYSMGAGAVFMVVYFVSAAMIAIAVPLMMLASGAGIAFGVVLITLAVLLILAGYMAVQVLSIFIMPAAVFDRQYHFKAVGTSIRMGWKHFFPVLGVKLVSGLLLGVLAVLLFGVLFAIAWAGPSLPIYTLIWYGCLLSLAWPFDMIVNGVLYRHMQARDESETQPA